MDDNPGSIPSKYERCNEDVNHVTPVNLVNDESTNLRDEQKNILESRITFSNLLEIHCTYTCNICEENYATSSLLIGHKSVHLNEIVSVFSSFLENLKDACKLCTMLTSNLPLVIVEMEELNTQVLSDESGKLYETALYDNAVKTLQLHNVDAVSCPLYKKILEITKSYNCDDYLKKCSNIENLNKLNCPVVSNRSKKLSSDKSNKDLKYKNPKDRKQINLKNRKRKYEARHLDNANNNVESLTQFKNCSNVSVGSGFPNTIYNGEKYDCDDNEHEAKLQQTTFNAKLLSDKIIIDHPELVSGGKEPIKLVDSHLHEHVNQLGIFDVDVERKYLFGNEFLNNIPFVDEKNDVYNVASLSFKTNEIVNNEKSIMQLEQLVNVNVGQSTNINTECMDNLQIENNCETQLQCDFEVDNQRTLHRIHVNIKLEVDDKDEIINADYPEIVDLHDIAASNDHVTFNTNNNFTNDNAMFYTKDSNGALSTKIESIDGLQPDENVNGDVITLMGAFIKEQNENAVIDNVKMEIEVAKTEIIEADYSEMSFNSIEEAEEFLKSEGHELNNEIWQLTEKNNSFVEHLFDATYSKDENKTGNDNIVNKMPKKNSIKGQLSTKAKIDVLAKIKVPHAVLSNDFQEISPLLDQTFNEMVVVDILTKVQQAISVDGAELFQTCSDDNPSFLALSNKIKPSPQNVGHGDVEKIKELNILRDPNSNNLPSMIPVLVVYEGSKKSGVSALNSGATHKSIINYLRATTNCLEAYLLLDNNKQQSLLKFVNEDVFKVKVRKTPKKILPGEPFLFKNSDFFVWHGNKKDAKAREYNLKRVLNYPHKQDNKSFLCGMCRSKHTDRIAFVRHLWFHAKAKPFKCEITRSTSKISRHTEQYVRCLVDTPLAVIPKEAKDALEFYRKKHTRLLPYIILTDNPKFLRRMKSQNLIMPNQQLVLDVWRQVWNSGELKRAGIFRSVLDGIDEPFSILSNQIQLNKSEKKIKDVFVLLGADFGTHRSCLPVLIVHSVLYLRQYAKILKGMVLDKVNGNILNEIKTITRWRYGYFVFPGLETETTKYVDDQTITFKRTNLKNSLQCRLCLEVINIKVAFSHGQTTNNACAMCTLNSKP